VTNPPAEHSDQPDGATTGLRHRHELELVTSFRGLQAAHHWLHWDTAKSRIICGERDRATVIECSEPDCTEHAICQHPDG
jgi:hypothetical protein